MAWTPQSREELDAEIAEALEAHDDDVRAWWDRIRIEPARWQCSPWGDEGGGFWAVAIDHDRVLWFDDIEEGFSWSPFSVHGTIGKYDSDQVDFVGLLDRVAHAQSERTLATLDEGGVPGELAGPGVIERRQTTYWELRTASGARWRAHFRDKLETGFAGAAYPGAEIVTRHPLLAEYDGPWQSLYFSGRSLHPGRLAEELARAVQNASAGWRRLAGYSSHVKDVEGLLRTGHGLLMRAPAPVCAAAAAVLEKAGVLASLLDGGLARPIGRLLLLGRSYVIAHGFAFERMDRHEVASPAR